MPIDTLCWADLLKMDAGATWYRTEEALFLKTPSWKEALAPDTDGEVSPATRH